MAQRSEAIIKAYTAAAKAVVRAHFGSTPPKLEYKPAGHTNFVFQAQLPDGVFIVRMSPDPHKLQDYLKEQWVVSKARKIRIPVAEVLEAGFSDAVPGPYMIQRSLEGTEAIDHPGRFHILRKLGALAAHIHKIKTTGYGPVFDWSENQLSKCETWEDFWLAHFKAPERLSVLKRHKMLDPATYARLKSLTKAYTGYSGETVLQHGDLRLKNVIVDKTGAIQAVIDWEQAISLPGPAWDLSIALHDLSIDNKQSFLEGYGLSPKEYKELSPLLTTINLLNYAPAVERIARARQTERLEYYRLRMHGALDLFSF